MKLYIKYMVSIRCKLLVKAELKNLGLHFVFVDLGEIEIMEDLTAEAENLDHRFSPKVITHLNTIRAGIQSGTKTFTEMEVEEYLREKANKCRESHLNV